jgi:hypothetical protein
VLRRNRFIDAVAEAREAVYSTEDNTWAAYQCYGDPDWVFGTEGGESDVPTVTSVDEFAGAPIRIFRGDFLEGLGIDLLIEINPKHTRKKCQHGGERQEQQDRPDCNLIQAPPCQGPKGGGKNKDDGKAQAVTYVHRSEKISWLPIEVEAAGGTAIMHFREAPIDRRTENCRGPASRTQLAEDAAQDRWTRREQEHMIVEDIVVDRHQGGELGRHETVRVW